MISASGRDPNPFTSTSTPLYSQFIHLSRYSRWLDDKNRRETWEETVQRYIDFFSAKFPELASEIGALFDPIYNLSVMPSMRCLMTAGPALERDHVSGYNCSYVVVDSPRAFDEVLYILCCGTGVGFSVERQYVSKLPDVAETFHDTDTVIVVADSKIGWATALRQLISLLYTGMVPKWDTSKVRPAGARLKTFGGRASGPEPLERLFRYCVSVFRKAAGRKLSSLECHDLICMIADIVVVGGVRRSALISLSNLSDDRMRLAKTGQWWETNGHRQLANNSACYTEKPEFEIFLNEWLSLYSSRNGERGIFNRVASKKQAAASGRRDPNYDFGTNPCSEIVLRPNQFCNLSEVVVRSTDSLDLLKQKVEWATILGTLQATLTNFRYLRKQWENNTKEEALLGVSMTGIMDHQLLGNPDDPELDSWLTQLREVAIETNKKWAALLGINPSTAITAVKPSGTVSQLVDSASGIHPRFSKYYIRRVRADRKDPLAKLMADSGSFIVEPDARKPDDILIFSFPIKSPSTASCVADVGAMHQLKLWAKYQKYWCEHKPSITVYYKDSEFLEIGNWIWNNFDSVSGISFLPSDDHVYVQAPYEQITKEQYEAMLAKTPTSFDWSKLKDFESEDQTSGTQTLACAGGFCEIVDLTGKSDASNLPSGPEAEPQPDAQFAGAAA